MTLIRDPRLGILYRADPASRDAGIITGAIRDYSEPGVSAADTVLDLGAHIGSAAAIFLHQGARVVCVEPDPGNLEILKPNIEGKAATFLHAAVAPAGVSTVGLWRHQTQNAVHRTKATPGRLPPVEVRAVSLEDLLHVHAPTVIKCDIEHAEHELLALRSLPPRVRLLFIELHGAPEQITDLERAILAQGFTAARRRQQEREGRLFGVCAAYRRGET